MIDSYRSGSAPPESKFDVADLWQRVSARGSWSWKIGWAVLDQSLLAGSNFLVSVLLAQWLDVRAYGAFAIAFSILLLLAGLYQSLLLVPSGILAVTTYKDAGAAYQKAMVRAWAFASIMASGSLLLLGALTFFLENQRDLRSGLFGAAVAVPCILLLWLGRNLFYLKLSPAPAALGAIAYATLLAIGLYCMNRFNIASPFAGFAVMGLAAGLLGSYLLYLQSRKLAPGSATVPLGELWRTSWEFGRWELAISLAVWLPSNAGYLLSAGASGTESAGDLRALLNLALPIGHAFAAVLRLAQPYFSKAFSDTRRRRHHLRQLWQLSGLAMLVSLVYLVAVSSVGNQLVALLYRGKFQHVAHLVPWIILTTVFWAGAEALGVGLRALRASSSILKSYCVAGGVFIVLGFPLASAFGLQGLVAALICTNFAALLVHAWELNRVSKLSDAAPSTGSHESNLRVLLSVYACEPGKGSESGIGWTHVREISTRHRVWALTREKNRAVIEESLAAEPLPNVQFVYYDLPSYLQKFQSGHREFIYYIAWQLGVYRPARKLHAEIHFDIVHHVTFGTYWLPSLLARLSSPFVWGPVGGADSTPNHLRGIYSSRGKRMDTLRNLIRWTSYVNPLVAMTAKNASVGIAATDKTAERMRQLGCKRTTTLTNAVVSTDEVAHLASQPPLLVHSPFRIVNIGRLLHWKGVSLSIRAFAEFQTSRPDSEFSVIGVGPELEHLKALANSLGIADKVKFLGQIPRDQVVLTLASSHVLLNPSLHDSGGWIYVEAMSAGKPVICLDLAGPGHLVHESTGIKIFPGSEEQVLRDMVSALARLAGDRKLCESMGGNGLKRVRERFTWASRLEIIDSLYQELADANKLRKTAMADLS